MGGTSEPSESSACGLQKQKSVSSERWPWSQTILWPLAATPCGMRITPMAGYAACVRACVHACVRACVHAFMRSCVHAMHPCTSTASDKDMFGRQQNCGCNADEAERLFTRAVACDPFDAYNQANFGIFLRCALCLSGLFFPSECLPRLFFAWPPMLPVPCEFSFCPDAQHCPKG